MTIENLSSQFGLSQIINEATHILEASSSCIDLIFTTQPNLVVESGAHPSLHANCHHQLVFAKFNLQIYYPPPYPREIWHYIQANSQLIRRAISTFNWDRTFLNTNVNEKVSISTSTVMNILNNFIPHETIVCDDKDPPWFNKAIKYLIQKKKDTFKKYRKSNNNIQLLQSLRLLQEKLNPFISASKQSYYSRMSTKLTKFHKSSKAYWSLLKTFLNNRKIPVIPPLYHEGNFVTNFKKKAEVFNSFFASQCSLIKNDSKLPSHLNYKPNYRLLTVNFSIDDITKILQNLDPNKSHGHDKISIRMLQLCGNSICKPLELIFKQSMESGSFPSERKKGNVVPIHKKDDKQCLSNYRPVSLLPICGKIFERLIFNEVFKFIENEFISPNQSGFKPGDSCTNQLLAITHEIYKSFDEGFEVRGVFVDISKAFDKI